MSVVTRPFNYGNVMQQAARINRTNALTDFTQQQTQAQQMALQRDEAFRNALSSGDMSAATQADPLAAQRFQSNEQALYAQRLSNLRARAPAVIPMLDRVINSKNPAQMASLVGDQLEEMGIGQGQIKSFLSGAPTNEAIVQGAQGLRDRYSEILDQSSAPQIVPQDIAEQMGFRGGTVVQQTPEGFKVLQETPLADPLAERKQGEKVAESESKLRKEFNGITKSFREVDQAYERVLASVKKPSAAGDLALVFNYMKMLDPGSTVREGEFANAQNAAGVPGRIIALYNNVAKGERMSAGQREDFESRAQELYFAAASQATQQAEFYGGLADEQGLSRDNVVGGFKVRERVEEEESEEGWVDMGNGVRIRELP